MKARIACAAALAAAALLGSAAAAQAEPVPEEPSRLFLKDHEDIPLAVSGGEAVLSADADLWTLRAVEALLDLGEYQIVHDESGQCLTADTSGGEAAVPVVLADCADAVAWGVVYHDVPSHRDFRFTGPDGYFLGLLDDASAVEGAAVLAVAPETDHSLHFQEWRFAAADAPPPTSAPPNEAVSASEAATSAAAQPKLPSTGGAAGAAVGAGAVALAGGTALVLWWQRRRALRSHW
ncbi:LPXTG cell wall anchor domain-containing protein [Glycomyces albidus]|uniref:LPXTG cell wall anchor domain-containing protein n=1 Tax=Glycomyces albidus TaxID=2656774 RepID=A0A6L5GBX3_9ACTN|nr:LPXTG cell wall anchor domain-containing protein [Glycomyces albidus]MQM27185.1 LPXTG cell wall anchor domain-containing protein [Glycomyces albidus]